MKLLIASRNQGKVSIYKELLKDVNVEVLSLSDINCEYKQLTSIQSTLCSIKHLSWKWMATDMSCASQTVKRSPEILCTTGLWRRHQHPGSGHVLPQIKTFSQP